MAWNGDKHQHEGEAVIDPEPIVDPTAGPLDPWFGDVVDELREIVRVYDTNGEAYLVRVQDVIARCPLHRSRLNISPGGAS